MTWGLLGTLSRNAGDAFGSVEVLWRDLFGGQATRSGITVTWQRALQVTTVLRCGQIIGEGLAATTCGLYRKQIVEGRTRRTQLGAGEHPLVDVLDIAPNDFQTSFEFFEQLGLHLALCRNAYCFINRVRDQVVELLPFEPQHVWVERLPDWSLLYHVTDPVRGTVERFPAEAIWHLRGLSWNGWQGLEAIRLAREAIGLALAGEESHARMHDQAVRPSGVLSLDATLKEADFVRLRKWVDAYFAGRQNAGKALILDRAAKWQTLQMTGVEAQHLQTRGFQIEEICRAMGVLPIMVGHTGDKAATYASAEQMFLAHLSFTLRPLYVRTERSIRRWLLTAEERRAGLYAEFDEEEFLRTSLKERGEYLERVTNAGLLVPNEGRDLMGYDAIDGLDKPRAPLNHGVINRDGRLEAPAAEPSPEPADEGANNDDTEAEEAAP